MKLVRNLLIGIVALVVILAVIGFFLPRMVHLERSIVIDAPQNTVFTLLSGFTRFNEWSPWAEIDPDTAYTFSGPSHGVGAAMAWQSDDRNVGSGSQEIKTLTAPSRVESALDFGPQGTADAFFNLEPTEDGVKVTWGFDSDLGMNPVGRYFGLMLDGMLGPQYEQGLDRLKTLAEGLSDVDFAGLETERTEIESQPIAYFSGSTTQTSEDIAQALGDAYGKVVAFIAEHGLEAAGPPISINRRWEDGVFEFDAALPLIAAPEEGAVAEDSEVKIGTTWGGEVLKTRHTGSYESLPQTYEKIMAYLSAHGFQAAGDSWDTWVSDPASTPEDQLLTEIFFPLS